MKKSPFQIVILLLVVVALLLPLHWLPAFELGGLTLKRVSLISDLIPKEEAAPEPAQEAWLEEAPADDLPLLASQEAPQVAVSSSDFPAGVVGFEDFADEQQRGLTPFYKALTQVDERDHPVRIAYLGDSFIEVDIFTADLRELLQAAFGGHGVGFLDIDPPYASNRATVRQRSGAWESHSSVDKSHCNDSLLNLNQRYFTTSSTGWTEVSGVKKNFLDSSDVHTIYLRSSQPATVGVKLDEGPMLALYGQGGNHLEALRMEGRSKRVSYQVEAVEGLVCWGVAQESRTGVILDNFSLRGSGGQTLGNIPEETLREFNQVRPYDLIVLQFGLNVANKEQTNYSAYARRMISVIERLKKAFPQAGLLVVSVGDREDKTPEGEMETLPGIEALTKYQRQAAMESHVAFWNLFEAMGGHGSICRMAEASPPMASKDYTHINSRGGQHLARIFFQTLQIGLDAYRQK